MQNSLTVPRRPSRVAAALCGVGIASLGTMVMAAAPATASPSAAFTPITYTDTTQVLDETVPAGACSATFSAIGGSGGDGGGEEADGGLAGAVTGTFTVAAGDEYDLFIGSAGTDGTLTTNGAGGVTAGSVQNGGGGDGGLSAHSNDPGGGGGGGGTYMFLAGGDSPALTAGGGGGGGGSTGLYGGHAGITGQDGAGNSGYTGGSGGTNTTPGAGGTGQHSFENGSDANGPAGGDGAAAPDDQIDTGGGGGGGYYGGGGGTTGTAGSGGGGGGNFIPSDGTSDVASTTGDGSVTVTYHACVTTSTAPVFVHDSPPGGTAGTAYSYTVTTSGSPAATYALASGALPAGLHLNATTGVISGTPTAAGSYSFVIEATNSAGHVSTPTLHVVVAAVAVTAPVATTPVPTTPVAVKATTAATLPFTGLDSTGLGIAGVVTMLAGLGLRVAGRRRR